MEVIVDILLVLVEIIHEQLCRVALLPIGVVPCMRDVQRVGLEIVADELSRIILVERRGYN